MNTRIAIIPIRLGRYQADANPAAVITADVRGKPFSLTLDLRQPSQRYIHDCHVMCGWYDRQVVEAMHEHLDADGVFFDVGAHVGYFSAIAHALGARVLAFEGEYDNFAQLQRNVECEMKFHVIGAKQDVVTFYINKDNDGGHALWNPALHPHNELTREIQKPQVTTHCRTYSCYQYPLNDYALYRPTVLKIDTEGAEVEVLKGASAILAQPQLRLVICELNHFGLAQMGSDEAEMRAIMSKAGFSAPENADENVGNLFFTRG